MNSLNMDARPLALLRAALFACSLVTTFAYLVDVGSILIAIMATLVQAAVLIYLVPVTVVTYRTHNLIPATVAGLTVTLVLVVSIVGSTSLLTGSLLDTNAEQRAVLEGRIAMLQKDVDNFLDIGQSTNSKPSQKELKEAQAELQALPAPSGLYKTAVSLAGDKANQVITGFSVLLAVLLDITALVLGMATSRHHVLPVVRPTTPPTTPPQPPKKKEPVAELEVFEGQYANELGLIDQAVKVGGFNPSATGIRGLLSCGTTKASKLRDLYAARVGTGQPQLKLVV
ncbi:hypothetical protein ACWJJH_14175 [Endozoicomonadaceae bacterium StTr2]